MNAERLSRDATEVPPVRIVHLGLGNFFRAHQAWYTDQVLGELPTQDRWGIAAFSGRSRELVDQLGDQDLLYTLIVSAPEGPKPEVLTSLGAAHAGDDLTAWRHYWASPQVSVVTLTVTEAGYRARPDGGVDTSDQTVAADIVALSGDPEAAVASVPGRLVAGLLARRQAEAGSIAIVPCDNLPDNGQVVRGVVLDLAQAIDPTLPGWIEDHVAWVTTMVDRITPRATEQDRQQLAASAGIDDPACVVTEPFHEWVLSGDFPAGRPAWEKAGARFVDDIAPYEQRKLWMLNATHSLLAYAGGIRGHSTVSEAIADEELRSWVEQWWDATARHLRLPAEEISEYRSALLGRYENSAIRHLLAQIAADGYQKIPVRIVPVLRAELRTGADLSSTVRPLAAWIVHARGAGAPMNDANEDVVRALVVGPLDAAVERVLDEWDLGDPKVRSALSHAVSVISP